MPTDRYNRLGSIVHKVNKLPVCGYYCMVPLNSGAVATLFDIAYESTDTAQMFKTIKATWVAQNIETKKFQYRYCVTGDQWVTSRLPV